MLLHIKFTGSQNVPIRLEGSVTWNSRISWLSAYYQFDLKDILQTKDFSEDYIKIKNGANLL